MSFRASFLKTVRLSKQVLRESGSDRNFGYFQSLPTVCRTLSYTHTHQCFQNGCHKKTLVRCFGPLCMDLVIKTQFKNVLTCGAELIKSLRLFQLFTLSERKNHESLNTTVQVSLFFVYLFI